MVLILSFEINYYMTLYYYFLLMLDLFLHADLVAPANSMFSNALRSKVILDSKKAQIELPGTCPSVGLNHSA